ncbi:hypothetical protein OH492_12410 [Vibrio chagasii]|nr:hypothetical protein [Vibrio chagasii]
MTANHIVKAQKSSSQILLSLCLFASFMALHAIVVVGKDVLSPSAFKKMPWSFITSAKCKSISGGAVL